MIYRGWQHGDSCVCVSGVIVMNLMFDPVTHVTFMPEGPSAALASCFQPARVEQKLQTATF